MATPKRKSLISLLLLLSLSAFFLFSLYPTSLTPSPSSSFSFSHNLPSSKSNFTFTIKLLTFNRLFSLSRCLNSLSAAHYDGDTVNLHIYIDHFVLPPNGLDHGRQSLNLSHQILNFVDGFHWRFGQKLVHYRTSNAGLQAQWLEAWWPSSDDEFAFVVEDDLELSPLYYRFLKGLIMNYYYNESNFSPMIYGASLQRPRFVPGKHGNKIQLDSETHLFLYQLVGTWGQLLFPRPWKEFRLWYDTRKMEGIKPLLEGMVTTGWYKKMGERIWTPWFIKFIHARGYFNIYTNLLLDRALSVSHRDAGVNYGKNAGPDSSLVTENSLDFDLFEMQPLKHLKWYDFCFQEVVPDRLIRSSNELSSVLHSITKLDTFMIVSLLKTSESAVMNLLCHFQRLKIQNYILVGRKSDFLLNLARRGHLVVDVYQFFVNSGLLKDYSLKSMDILVKGYVISKVLEHGCSLWVMGSNVLPLSHNLFLDSLDFTSDIHIWKTFRTLYISNSSSVSKSWGKGFVRQVANFIEKDPHSAEISFVNAVEKYMEENNIHFTADKDMHSGFNVLESNRTSTMDRSTYAFWPPEIDQETVQDNLQQLGLWVTDSDLSCIAVICHPT